MKSRFIEAQIIASLKEQEAGMPAAEVRRRHGLGPATVCEPKVSGVDDGAAALIVADKAAAKRHGLTPIARALGRAVAGVPPRIMGFGPAPASKKLMARLDLSQDDFDVIELNEAFASQGLATLRDLGIADDDKRVNRNGGAIALGHPPGMSGGRIAGSTALELLETGGRRALSTMCIGLGQGFAIALERVRAQLGPCRYGRPDRRATRCR